MFTSRKQKNKRSTWSWKGPYQPKILSEYVDFLRNHRGLNESTIRFRRNDVISFLQPLRIQNNDDIGKISAKQIYDYIIRTAKTMPLPSRRHIVASIRSFLKFAHLKGYIQRDLTEAVPVIGTPKYRSLRAKHGHDQKPNAPFFINEHARRCSHSMVGITFRDLIQQLGIRTVQGRIPRLHDFRHTFATRYLNEVYQTGRNPNASLPLLATYLGHVKLTYTQVYLHPAADLLATVGQRFYEHIHKSTDLLKGGQP